MRPIPWLAAVSVVAVGALLAGDARACSCNPQGTKEHMRTAEWIFIGTVTEASLSSSIAWPVHFSVEPTEVFRGDPKELQLNSDTPGCFGIPITVGFSYLFFLDADKKEVTSCTGSTQLSEDNLLYVAVLRSRDDVALGRNREMIVDNLEGLYGRSREAMLGLLEYLQALNPKIDVAEDGESITFGDIVLRFDKGKYVSVH